MDSDPTMLGSGSHQRDIRRKIENLHTANEALQRLEANEKPRTAHAELKSTDLDEPNADSEGKVEANFTMLE